MVGSFFTSALVGGGKGGFHLWWIAAHTSTSISGGAHADTITIVSAVGAVTSFYGDTVGAETTSTDAATDRILATGANPTTASSIYGGGGNDTIFSLLMLRVSL